MPSATTTEAQVCNLALVFVGHGQAILDNLDENTSEAKACKVIYSRVRDELLEKYSWKFAKRRAVLALSATEERSGWGFVYALPVDCLAPLYIYAGTRNPDGNGKIPFDWEAGVDGAIAGPALLLTDQEDAELVYTAQVKTVALFTPGFVKALAWAVAVELCLVLPVKPQVALAIEGKAKRALLEAKASMENHSQRDREPESEYISGR